jgi:hypothetical protein
VISLRSPGVRVSLCCWMAVGFWTWCRADFSDDLARSVLAKAGIGVGVCSMPRVGNGSLAAAFRRDRRLWYVQLNGRQINLGPDQDAAFKEYHWLMGEPRPVGPAGDNVLLLVEEFLDYCQKHRARETYQRYKERLDKFCNYIPKTLRASELRNFHVQRWIDSYPQLSSGSKRNMARSIQRAMRWAVKIGHIGASPIAEFVKPKAGKREQVVSQTEFDRLLEFTKDEQLRDLLTVTWEARGPRPRTRDWRSGRC